VNIDERRINFEGYRKAKEHARKQNRFFVWSGVNVFEMMHPLCGHENLLMGMALDPEWITDMAKVYADMTLTLQEIWAWPWTRSGLPTWPRFTPT